MHALTGQLWRNGIWSSIEICSRSFNIVWTRPHRQCCLRSKNFEGTEESSFGEQNLKFFVSRHWILMRPRVSYRWSWPIMMELNNILLSVLYCSPKHTHTRDLESSNFAVSVILLQAVRNLSRWNTSIVTDEWVHAATATSVRPEKCSCPDWVMHQVKYTSKFARLYSFMKSYWTTTSLSASSATNMHLLPYSLKFWCTPHSWNIWQIGTSVCMSFVIDYRSIPSSYASLSNVL